MRGVSSSWDIEKDFRVFPSSGVLCIYRSCCWVCRRDQTLKWSNVAGLLPGRLGKQCRERWFNHLDPTVKKTAWTPREDEILFNAQVGTQSMFAVPIASYSCQKLATTYRSGVLGQGYRRRCRQRRDWISKPACDARAVLGIGSPALSEDQSSASTKWAGFTAFSVFSS